MTDRTSRTLMRLASSAAIGGAQQYRDTVAGSPRVKA